jgi:hypothetical protein
MTSKHLAKLLGGAATALVAIYIVWPAAHAATPAEGYGQFEGCPSPKTENSEIATCLRSEITGGHFKMGNKNVPITKPITLSGGINTFSENFDYNAKGGLSEAKQQVPGGVIGLTGLDWLVNFLNIEQLKLYAVTELAGTPVVKTAENVELPIKVRLINPVLGSKCYVGSNSTPIKLNLITGTTAPPAPNEPITGKEPEYVFEPGLEILRAFDGIFVDNSFAAPGANGCTLTLFGFIPVPLNGVVNLASGLPAAAGTNETVQNYDLEIAEAAMVYP